MKAVTRRPSLELAQSDRATIARREPRETIATLSVVGMTCDHCVHAVSAEVAASPGVLGVVDLAGKKQRLGPTLRATRPGDWAAT